MRQSAVLTNWGFPLCHPARIRAALWMWIGKWPVIRVGSRCRRPHQRQPLLPRRRHRLDHAHHRQHRHDHPASPSNPGRLTQGSARGSNLFGSSVARRGCWLGSGTRATSPDRLACAPQSGRHIRSKRRPATPFPRRARRATLTQETTIHPAQIPQEAAGSSRPGPSIPATSTHERPAPAGDPRLSRLSPQAPRPACHAGGRGFESRRSRKVPVNRYLLLPILAQTTAGFLSSRAYPARE